MKDLFSRRRGGTEFLDNLGVVLCDEMQGASARREREPRQAGVTERCETATQQIAHGTMHKHERFESDDWNLTLVLDGANSNALNETYTWGMDLSQTLQGAGGVGGLLSVDFDPITNAGEHTYLYDANGNVGQLVDGVGAIAASYEYTPFGNLSSISGPMANENVFRFSTKFADDETSLYYYGFRYLDSGNGRWLSRDPITDNVFRIMKPMSGIVLFDIDPQFEIEAYLYSLNDSIGSIDLLGLCRIWYDCTVESETGDCDKDCKFKCVETNRQQPGFGPNTPCSEVTKPYEFTQSKTANGISLLGCCLKEGKCEDYSGVSTVGGGGFPCSKKECKSSCKSAFSAAKRVCPKGPMGIPCKIAAAAAKKACLAGCELCDEE